MTPDRPILVGDVDTLMVTAKGNKELQASSTALSAAAVKLLVLVDGSSRVGLLRERSRPTISDAQFDAALQDLLRGSFVDFSTGRPSLWPDALEFFSSDSRPPSEKTLNAVQSEAVFGINTLKQHGYFVRIAMRPLHQDRPLNGETVLVVEDDAVLSTFLRKYLELEGFSAVTALNRAEIIDGLRRQPPPDLVLLDVMLPDVDGFDVLQKMRAHPVLKSVPVLMLTAKATREDVLRGLALGANGYITKPFQVDALSSAVKTVLGIK